MILLTAEQIHYCQVIFTQGNQSQILEGVAYQDKLFTSQQRFPKDQKQAAIQQAKALVLSNKGKFLVLLVESAKGYRIWQQNHQVRLREIKDFPISEINLEELIGKMRNVGGIRIEERQYRLKTYSRCFVGNEAVTWLTQTLNLTKEQAIQLGQRLMDEKWIHHVSNEHQFEDGYLFYRFYWDE